MNESLPLLPRGYPELLVNLYEAGGSADIQNDGRVTVGPTRHFLSGDATAWFRLMGRGYVAGELDKVILTEMGRAKAAEMLASRVKVAWDAPRMAPQT